MKLSFFILTYNSERYLNRVLESVASLVDEMVVVDSGSRDHTLVIAQKFNARVFNRPFDTFAKQRQFAINLCEHPWIFTLDSDEILDHSLVKELHELKKKNFFYDQGVDSFYLQRKWFVLNKEVHALYPVKTPDQILCLYLKERASFKFSRAVYEQIHGLKNHYHLNKGFILHYAFEGKQDFIDKLQHYTTLAAIDLVKGRKKMGFPLLNWLHALGTWVKWYLLNKSYKDGSVGWHCGLYAFRFIRLKYKKLRSLRTLETQCVREGQRDL